MKGLEPGDRSLSRLLSCLSLLAIASCKSHSNPARSEVIKADRIVVLKSPHTLMLYHQGEVLKTYKVALGRGGLEAKAHEGDNRVPEGVYRISSRNKNSAFYRALRVSYPTLEQKIQARQQGIDPGGSIMVHGIKNGFGWIGALHRHLDWTKGCIAVTNDEMDEIWRSVPDGTVIEIDR